MCLGIADVDRLLAIFDVQVLFDANKFQALIASCTDAVLQANLQFLTKSLNRHAEAFDAGYIDTARLIKVLYAPFLKLAKAANQAAQHPGKLVEEIQGNVQRHFLAVWFRATGQALDGAVEIREGGLEILVPNMSASKRATLVKQLVKINFFQVFFCTSPVAERCS